MGARLARLAPALATAVLVPLFIHLGLWQAGKAERQRAAQAQYEAGQRALPVELGSAAFDPRQVQYRRVRLRGRFDAAHQILLDNQLHEGRAGFHVITPLRLASGGVVLVNRGWIPAPPNRSIIPAAAPPAGEQVLTGELMAPPRPRWLATAAPAEPGWPAIWQALQFAEVEARGGFATAPLLLRLDPESPAGLTRRWEPFDSRAAMHQGYAYQWFAFATLVAGTFVFSVLRRKFVPGVRACR